MYVQAEHCNYCGEPLPCKCDDHTDPLIGHNYDPEPEDEEEASR